MDFFGNLWPRSKEWIQLYFHICAQKEGIIWRVSTGWSEEQSVPAGISSLLHHSSLEWMDFGSFDSSWAKHLANFASVKAARLSPLPRPRWEFNSRWEFNPRDLFWLSQWQLIYRMWLGTEWARPGLGPLPGVGADSEIPKETLGSCPANIRKCHN